MHHLNIDTGDGVGEARLGKVSSIKELKKQYFIDPWESLKPIKLISSTRNLNVVCGEKPRVRLFRDGE